MPLEVNEGQTPLAAAVSFFDEEPDRFRGLLVDAELPDVAAQVQNAELRNAAQQIRSIKAATEHVSVAWGQGAPRPSLRVLGVARSRLFFRPSKAPSPPASTLPFLYRITSCIITSCIAL